MTKALVNSFLVAGTITFSVVLFSTLAGFAFAKLRFRGRNVLLLLIIATMMVPTQLGIIPLYMLMAKFMLVGKLSAVIVPTLVSAFGVFFMTQYLQGGGADRAARGGPRRRLQHRCASSGTWCCRPPSPPRRCSRTLTFMTAWNDFFWPLVVLTPDDPTVQVALSTLSSGYITDFSLVARPARRSPPCRCWWCSRCSASRSSAGSCRGHPAEPIPAT